MANTVFELQGVISLDTSGFVNAINKAKQTGDNLRNNIERVSDTMRSTQRNFENTTSAITEMGNGTEKADDKLTTLKNKLEVTKAATAEAAERVEYLTENFNQYAETAGAASEDTQNLYDALQNAEKQLAQCEAAEMAAQQELDNFANSAGDAGDNAEQAASGTEHLGSETESAGNKAEESGNKFEQFASMIQNVGNVAKTVAETVVGAATAIAGTIATATATAGTGLVKGVSELAAYGDTIDKQSQKIGISAKAYQEWDAILQHSGTSIGVLQAGMRTLRNAMDSLGDATGDAVVDQDKLAAAQTKYDNAVLSAEKAQLDYNAAIEKYGEESDQAVSKLIALQKATNNVETAQSSLDKVMQGSTPKMSNAAQALHKLGISAVDANGKLRDEEEVFSEVITALQNMENETEKTRLATVLLSRGGTELGALLNTTAEDTEKMRKRVNELNGVLSDESVKAAARFQDSLQDMKTGFNGLTRSITAEFLPSFATVMDGITEIFANNSENGGKLIEQGLSEVSEKIEKVLPKILEIGGKVTQYVDKLAPIVFNAFTIVADNIASGIENINVDDAIDSVLNALEVGAKSVGKVADTIGDFIVKSLESLSKGNTIDKVFTAIGNTITKSVDKLATALPKITRSVSGIISKVLKTLPDLIGSSNSDIITAIVESAIEIANAVVNNIEPIIDVLTTAIPQIVDGLLKNADKIIGAANALIIALVDSITKDNGILDGVVKMVESIVNSITENIDPILLATEKLLNTVIGKLLEPETLEKIVNSVAKVLSAAFLGAAKILGSTVGFTAQLGVTLSETIEKATEDAVHNLPDIFAGIGKSIIEGFGVDTTYWDEYFEEVGGKVFDFVDGTKTKIGTAIVNGFSDFTESVNKVLEFFEGFGGYIYDSLQKVGEDWDKFWTGVAEEFTKYINGIVDGINDIPNKIGELVNNAKQWGSNLMSNFLSGITEKIGDSKIAGIASKLLGFDDASKTIPTPKTSPTSPVTDNTKPTGTGGAGGVTINFTQNNTSPESLDEYEIWRQSQRATDLMRLQLQGG